MLKINKGELLNAMQFIISAVTPDKVMNPSYNAVWFDVSQDTAVLTVTGLESSANAKITCGATEEQHFALDAKLLMELVRTITNDDIYIENAKEKVIIKSGLSKFTIPTLNYERRLFELQDAKLEFEIEAFELEDALKVITYACTKERFARNLYGVFFEVQNGFLRAVATDGFRLALVDVPCQAQFEAQLLISYDSIKAIKQLIKSAQNERIAISLGDNKVGFFTRQFDLILAVVDTEFPDYKKVLPNSFATEITVLKKDFVDALKKASVIASKSDEKVLLNISDSVVISAENEFGHIDDQVDLLDKQGKDITILFNIKFLIEAVEHVDNDQITLQFVDNTSPMQIKNTNSLHIIMPIRMT